MVFVQDDHVVEKFATYGTDNTLGRPVLPWAPECGPLWIDLEALDRTRDCMRENRVVVVDQVSMGWFIGERLAELLDHPTRSWILGDVEVENSSPSVIDREPDVQQAKPNRRNDEEVHSRDHVLVIPEECHPSLLLGRVGFCPRYVARGGRQTHFDAEL